MASKKQTNNIVEQVNSNSIGDVLKSVGQTWAVNKINIYLPKALDALFTKILKLCAPKKIDDTVEMEELRHEIADALSPVIDNWLDKITEDTERHVLYNVRVNEVCQKLNIETGHNDYEKALIQVLKKRSYTSYKINEILSEVHDQLQIKIDIDKEVENINDLIEEIKQSEVDNYPIKVEYDDIEKFNQIFKELDQGMRESAYDLDTTIKQIHFMLIAGRITESQEKELAEYIKKLY